MDDKSLDVAAVIDRLGHGDVVNFDLANVRDVELWSGRMDGALRARALSALIDEQSSVELIAACADSIVAVDQWQGLLGELLLASEINPAVVFVASQVLQKRMSDHPLAKLSNAPAHAHAVYDAIGDGETFKFRLNSHRTSASPWIFFDLGDISGHFAIVDVEDVGGEIEVPVARLPWLDVAQAACLAFAVVF